MQCEGETRTALYRFYDARENLLYVGISSEPWRRWREHVATQPWYPQAKHGAVSWYDTERQAGAAELRAIRRERPRHNIAGAIRPPEARLTISMETVLRACAIWAAIVGLLAVLAVVLAVSVPAHSPAAVYVHVAGWAVTVAALSLPVPLLAGSLVAGAPMIYRFGCWLDRNFGELARRQAAEEAAERVALAHARHIPAGVWLLAPAQTYRMWRKMRTVGPRDYALVLEEELDRLYENLCPVVDGLMGEGD